MPKNGKVGQDGDRASRSLQRRRQNRPARRRGLRRHARDLNPDNIVKVRERSDR